MEVCIVSSPFMQLIIVDLKKEKKRKNKELADFLDLHLHYFVNIWHDCKMQQRSSISYVTADFNLIILQLLT